MEIELLPIPKHVDYLQETLSLAKSEFTDYINLSPTEINAICLQDKSKLDIFSKERFWQVYFNKRKLPMLEKGSNPASWSLIFRKSRDSSQVVNFLFAKLFPNSTILEYEMKGEENQTHFSNFIEMAGNSTILIRPEVLKKVFLRLHMSQREKKPFSFTSLNMFNMCRDESKIVFSLSFTKKANYLVSFQEQVNQDAKNKIVEQELTSDQAKKLALNVFYFYICT
ncbi:Hypothetical protein BQ3484_81 [Cedratvirus A11]|uniref:Uncharacterized protein n=1 Tax=Cedratvirus A11 TaxID=1903266 RepID=A0A1M7XTZ6_9VIRU|nr:Hypothetical protein BQ3484_81 [Cedratvirus A11]SHO33149.1 Hypothetical protein BQ3484_81 [Cedratvirus A11]